MFWDYFLDKMESTEQKFYKSSEQNVTEWFMQQDKGKMKTSGPRFQQD